MNYQYVFYGGIEYEGEFPEQESPKFDRILNGDSWDYKTNCILPTRNKLNSPKNIQEHIETLKDLLVELLKFEIRIKPSVLSYELIQNSVNKGECGAIECFSENSILHMRYHYFDYDQNKFVTINI